jgi:hypothetical protein
VGQRVDGDPVARLARGAAQQLPGPLGLGGERPLEEAEGEPAGLELASRKRRSATNRSGVGRPCGALRKPRCDGGEQRPADAVDGADAGRDPLLAGEVVRVGEPASPRSGRGEAVRVVAEVGEAVPSASAASRWAATNATAARCLARRLGRTGASITATVGARASGPSPAGRRSAREVALAAGSAATYDAGRGRQLGAGPASTMWPPVSTIRRRTG